MKCVYFEDGTIMEGKQCNIRKYLKWAKKNGYSMKYIFREPRKGWKEFYK